MRLSVNGRFYAARPTGVQRVARELVRRLVERAEVDLHVPARCSVPPAVAERARVLRGRLRGNAWEQVELPLGRRRGGEALPLDPGNAGPLLGPPGVMLLHDVLPLSHPGFYASGFRRWFALGPAGAARRALRIVTFSGWARDRVVELLGVDDARVRVISQGVEPFDRPAPGDRVRETLERLGLRPGYVLALGGGDPRKGSRFLEGVLRDWPESAGPAPDLVIVGEGDPRILAGGRRGGRASAHASAVVRRPGHVSDEALHDLYTAASVFCFPSRAEGFGRPPLEAMACGTPVVAADYGCAREILGDAAVVVPLDRPVAWADAVAALRDDGPAREARIAAGRAHAEGFRWDAAVEELLGVCREAAGEGSGPPGSRPVAAGTAR